jgi:hypothetical protein
MTEGEEGGDKGRGEANFESKGVCKKRRGKVRGRVKREGEGEDCISGRN